MNTNIRNLLFLSVAAAIILGGGLFLHKSKMTCAERQKGQNVAASSKSAQNIPTLNENAEPESALKTGDLLEMFIQYADSKEPALLKVGTSALDKVVARGMDALPELAAIMKDSSNSDRLRAAAAMAIGAIGKVPENDIVKNGYVTIDAGSRAQNEVPDLIEFLNDPGAKGSEDIIITALGQLGPDAKAAVHEIIKILSSGDKKIKLSAINALGKIGLREDIAVPALSGQAKSSDKEIAVEAVSAITRFGQVSRSLFSKTETDISNPTLVIVANALFDSLGSGFIEVQRIASVGLVGIAGQVEYKKSVLADALWSKDAEVRYNIAQVISRLAKQDKSYGKILEQAHKVENQQQVKDMLLSAMKELGYLDDIQDVPGEAALNPKAGSRLSGIKPLFYGELLGTLRQRISEELKADSSQVDARSQETKKAVANIVGIGADIVPFLLNELESRNRSEDSDAFLFSILEQIGKPAIAPMVEILKSQEPTSRIAVTCVQALPNMGEDALAAADVLVMLFNKLSEEEKQMFIGQMYIKALYSIKPSVLPAEIRDVYAQREGVQKELDEVKQ